MYSTRRIPAEIVHEIFSHLSSPLRVHEPREFPWYLGQICSEWRVTFLSMQSFFWNELEIETLEDRDGQSGPSPCTMAMIDFFLDNIRGASFSFTFFKQSKQTGTPYAHRILPKLVGHSMQWKNVSVRLLLSEVPFLCNAKNRLSSLKSLELILGAVDSIPGDQLTPQLGNIFEDAPLLTDIRLCYPSPLFSPQPIPWPMAYLIAFAPLTRLHAARWPQTNLCRSGHQQILFLIVIHCFLIS